jgi:hypothetical protein
VNAVRANQDSVDVMYEPEEEEELLSQENALMLPSGTITIDNKFVLPKSMNEEFLRIPSA